MVHAKVGAVMRGVFALSLAFVVSSAWGGQEGRQRPAKAKVELPPAVAKAVRENCPKAEIDKVAAEKEAGVVLYDIEFKADQGEIEVAEDGTVMDIATVISWRDLPKPAAEAIRMTAADAKVIRIERSEVRAEIIKDAGKGTVVKLAAPRYIYEAELASGKKKGEIQVAPDGKIIEPLKWGAEGPKAKEEIAENEEAEGKEEAEEKEESEQAKPAVASSVDLKILPQAVLSAFKASYPKAVIKGASKETEKGVTYYEVESVDGKMNRDILYKTDGQAVEVEESVAPEALPAAVLQALGQAYPGCKILKAEEMTKNGQKLFELHIRFQDKKIGVTVDLAGKIIK